MPLVQFLLLAAGISIFLHILALRLFPKLHLLDRPTQYGLTRKPLPYPTGIISVLTFTILFLLTRESVTFQDGGLILAIIILAAMTMTDDVKGLPVWSRLLLQILIGIIIFASGTRIYTITNPLGGILKLDTILIPDILSSFVLRPLSFLSGQGWTVLGGHLPLWSGVFTVLWLLLTMNAFNWFDGIPGQVSILSVIGSLTLGFLALSSRVDQPIIAMICFLLAGTAIASSFFDFPPNKAVTGDTGSMFFGLLLGTLSIYAGGKVATAFLVLGLPLIDSFLVILRRIGKGDSPFHGNLDHLHHRLLAKGWSARHIIVMTALIGSAFGVTALFLDTFQKFVAIILLIGLILCLTRYSRPVHPPKDQKETAHRG